MFIQFTNNFTDRSDYTMFEMDNDSNYIAWSDDTIEKLIKPKPRRRKHKCLPSESNEQRPTIFNVVWQRFTNKTVYHLAKLKNVRNVYTIYQ